MNIFAFGKKKNEESSLTIEKPSAVIKGVHIEPTSFSLPNYEIIQSNINIKRIKRLMWRNARRL